MDSFKKRMAAIMPYKKSMLTGKRVPNRLAVKNVGMKTVKVEQKDKAYYQYTLEELFERYNSDKDVFDKVKAIIDNYLSPTFKNIPCVKNGILLTTLDENWEDMLKLYSSSVTRNHYGGHTGSDLEGIVDENKGAY